ncbi:MAG TPA: hypothetical protein VGX21_09125 [Methylomirabilota bacterium]|jgi:hypothetical protein|nr:hypothetical protein [Methylomirabilota bacterium]
MRTPTAVLLVIVVTAIAIAATWSLAATPKQYQFTGNVVEVDAKSKKLAVDKGGDIWEFSTDGLKDFKAKKGDRITVYYQMVAKKVEAK